MTDRHTKEQRSYNMSQIKSKDTKPEIAVRHALHHLGYRYRKNDKRLPGKPDIYLPKYKTAIFINGCFWHGHKSCKFFKTPHTNSDYWSNKMSKTQIRDKKNYKLLRNKKINVITIWECEINRNLIGIIGQIDSQLKQSLNK